MLSKRASKSKGSPNILHEAWYKQHTNPYDAKDNPDGIINLGTAENRVISDVRLDAHLFIYHGSTEMTMRGYTERPHSTHLLFCILACVKIGNNFVDIFIKVLSGSIPLPFPLKAAHNDSYSCHN